VSVPSQKTELSCICLLGIVNTLVFTEVSVPSQKTELSCICLLGTVNTLLFTEVCVPSQKTELSCICLLGVAIGFWNYSKSGIFIYFFHFILRLWV
jgi:hypothetical protein